MKKERVNIVYYIMLIALLCVSFLVRAVGDYMSSNGIDALFTVLSQIVCMFLIPVLGYFLVINKSATKEQALSDFGYKPFKKGELGKVVLLGLLAIFLNTVFAQLNYGFLTLIGYQYGHSASHNYVANLGLFFLDIIMVAVLPAICEETAHRGLLRVGYGSNPAKYILISATLFSLMHQNISQMLYTFLSGILFASAVAYTGNIKSSMIMHFMVNVTEVITDLGLQLNMPILLGKNLLFGILLMNIGTKIVMGVLTVLFLYLFYRLLYSFNYKGNFTTEKAKRMLKDGSLTMDFGAEEKATTVSKVMLVAILFIGICCEIFTLTWGLMR